MSTIATREAWLETAVVALQSHVFDQADLTIPHVKVSCSWPGGGSPRKRIGECWARRCSPLSVNEIFISPKLADPVEVLGVLVHELVHAVDDCKHDHKAPFRRMARDVGLEGKPTSTTASAALVAVFKEEILPKLGDYPHGSLTPSAMKPKAPRSAFVKFTCEECDSVFRVTAGHAENVQMCPCCGSHDLVPE